MEGDGFDFGRLVGELGKWPSGITASNLGAELWGDPRAGDQTGARYARPAGKLLKKAIEKGLVREECHGKTRLFFLK